MRDGAELVATLVLPEESGAYPAILMRTPYGRDGTRDYIALAREGYAFIAQDMRGRFDSEGDNLAFVNDGWGVLQDGYDTVEWIAEQEWCDGRVGTIGASALGIAQNMLAGAGPPSLKAQVIIVAAASIYHDAAYVNGVLRESQVEDWLSGNEWDEENLQLIREHTFYDDYWRMLDLTTRAEIPFTPAMYFGGWYDTFAEGTLRGYDLRRHHAPNGSPDDTYLVMGPWTHGTMFDAATGGIELPPQAAGDFIPDVIAFFNYYLKGEDNGFAAQYPRVQYYAMGSLVGRDAPGNFWVAAADFPPEAEDATMFLAPEGRLESTLPDVPDHSVKLTFTPSDPVKTKGGRNLTIPAGPADQREVEKRADVISFTSEALKRPMPIAGLVTAQIAMAANAPDADISVRISDVYPDGTSFLILDGIARMSLPYPYTKPRTIAPGKFYRIPVELGHTTYIIDAEHKLRVALAASNHPRFELSPTLAEADKPVELRISLGGDMPSSLQFTVCDDLLNDG
jgi:predicted acyl esterase